MVAFCKRIADSRWFQQFIITVIILAGVLVGIQTYGDKVMQWTPIIDALDWLILVIFTIEVIIKITAEGNQPQNYFKDAWNLFDFFIVVACYAGPFLGDSAEFLPVLRLIRILRVFKLVTALPELQLIVGALLRSIPSMAYISLLLGLLFYIYGAMAVFLFGANDPIHFENLQMAILSLFRVITLEDWTDIMYINMYGCDNYGYGGNEALCTNPSGSPILAAMFFVSFVLIGTMIVLNLFIGVIMNGMDEMKAETELKAKVKRKNKEDGTNLKNEIHLLIDKVDGIKEELSVLTHLYDQERKEVPLIGKAYEHTNGKSR
ncbi:ion transporter [Aquimarina spongiae]|uniref:Voltage-gated sodium channel n=1 Tax=Aquimarina spongiae TaxID=570521 RepID=A0A1M6AMV6_9FLAO|nr:ion transporter [Aquimarina spongiae]SHI37668.1 voltage-gated sodium channel [Aquimarina spongiae]